MAEILTRAKQKIARIRSLLPASAFKPSSKDIKDMKIYTFASEAPNRLLAFAGDRAGSTLPERHGPWQPVGEIGPKEKVQHGLDRKRIEHAIHEHGYQMWRTKT